jgi:hypothetical protein
MAEQTVGPVFAPALGLYAVRRGVDRGLTNSADASARVGVFRLFGPGGFHIECDVRRRKDMPGQTTVVARWQDGRGQKVTSGRESFFDQPRLNAAEGILC